MILKGLWNLWMHHRLLHLFRYQMAKNDLEWIQEYAKKLNQYALTQQEIDDFQLCQVLQKCDYTYTNIGREYMYGRMVSGKYEYQLLETMIERYKDQKILSHTLYELYQLSKEYDRCLGLFDHHDVFTSFKFWSTFISFSIFCVWSQYLAPFFFISWDNGCFTYLF